MSGPTVSTTSPGTVSAQAEILAGAYVGPGVAIAAGVTVGPNACLIGGAGDGGEYTDVQAGALIGGNATVNAGVRIGAHARVAPGAVVMRSVPPYAIVQGNPARIVGYVNADTGDARTDATRMPDSIGVQQTRVNGVTLHRFRHVPDLRGSLSVGEFEREIPFLPRRYFLVFDVPTAETRGEHAHIECAQFLIAVSGKVSVVADDGVNREEFMLDRPNVGVYLPPMTWGIQYRYTPDAVLLVFASHYYAADDYVRDYDRFLELVRKRGHGA
jgi:UDP-2-acetamido-3-amino-2,3-dideoxy-glucuronate N-acetyltransferase